MRGIQVRVPRLLCRLETGIPQNLGEPLPDGPQAAGKRAIAVNVQIMRAFVQLRRFLSSQEQFLTKLATPERKLTEHDAELKTVFKAIRRLMARPPTGKKRQTGFVQDQDDKW
jgi:hypothetical protein